MENISPVYARFVLRELTNRGVEASEVLAGTGMPREQLETGGDLSVEDFVTILNNGRRLSGDEKLGLMIGRHSKLMTLGPLGAAVANAPTIREGLQTFETYLRLHTTYITMTLRSNLKGMSVEVQFLQDLSDTERFHSESAALMLQDYIETVAGRPLDDAHYHFSFPRPGYADEYGSCLHSRVDFGNALMSIELPRHWLELKSPYYHADLWRQSQLELSQKLKALGTNNERAYSLYIYSQLRSSEPPLPDLLNIAESLHLSERTLSRRLSQEGNNYRDIKSRVLKGWARQYLVHTNDSVESIAASLGYQDAANFRRAFRQWENCSPREFREQAGCRHE